MTTPILTTVQAWIQADGIDWDSYRTVMRAWVFDAYDSNHSEAAQTVAALQDLLGISLGTPQPPGAPQPGGGA